MMIRNLSQFKKAINNGCCFEILEHYIKPEQSGQIRKPTKTQTNGFYSKVVNDDNSVVNTYNGGKGSMMWYGKASDWIFENDYVIANIKGNPIYKIRFID